MPTQDTATNQPYRAKPLTANEAAENSTQVAQNTARHNPVGDIIENSRSTPAQAGAQTLKQGLELYTEGKRILTQDLEDMEPEEREILEKNPTNTRKNISDEISLGTIYQDFSFRQPNINIGQKEYLTLQRIHLSRRKRQIYGTP